MSTSVSYITTDFSGAILKAHLNIAPICYVNQFVICTMLCKNVQKDFKFETFYFHNLKELTPSSVTSTTEKTPEILTTRGASPDDGLTLVTIIWTAFFLAVRSSSYTRLSESSEIKFTLVITSSSIWSEGSSTVMSVKVERSVMFTEHLSSMSCLTSPRPKSEQTFVTAVVTWTLVVSVVSAAVVSGVVVVEGSEKCYDFLVESFETRHWINRQHK